MGPGSLARRIAAVVIVIPPKRPPPPSYPSTVEFDVVFPRSGTYAPTDLFPVIIGVQNPLVAATLRPNIKWSIRNHTSVQPLVGDAMRLSGPEISHTTSEHYYSVCVTNIFNNTLAEGDYWLKWTLSVESYTNDATNETGLLLERHEMSKVVDFRIRSGGAEAAAFRTSDSDCAAAPVALNVTRLLDVQKCGLGIAQSACPSLASEMPDATPCAVQVGMRASSSIVSLMHATACRSWPSPDCTSMSSGEGKRALSNVLTLFLIGMVCLIIW